MTKAETGSEIGTERPLCTTQLKSEASWERNKCLCKKYPLPDMVMALLEHHPSAFIVHIVSLLQSRQLQQ